MCERIKSSEKITENFEYGRCGVRIPAVPEYLESGQDAHDYMREFLILNQDLMQNEKMVIPANKDKPAVFVTVESSSRVIPNQRTHDYASSDVSYRWSVHVQVPPVEKVGQLESFLWVGYSSHYLSAGYYARFNDSECRYEDEIERHRQYYKDLKYTEEEFTATVQMTDWANRPTLNNAVRSFLELIS